MRQNPTSRVHALLARIQHFNSVPRFKKEIIFDNAQLNNREPNCRTTG
jgi:hypothetical protein